MVSVHGHLASGAWAEYHVSMILMLEDLLDLIVKGNIKREHKKEPGKGTPRTHLQ
jgi:hypothetical protein